MHSFVAETPQFPPPPHLGSYTRALLVSQDRRHLFVTPWSQQIWGDTHRTGIYIAPRFVPSGRAIPLGVARENKKEGWRRYSKIHRMRANTECAFSHCERTWRFIIFRSKKISRKSCKQRRLIDFSSVLRDVVQLRNAIEGNTVLGKVIQKNRTKPADPTKLV
jgi:hypothetical protein